MSSRRTKFAVIALTVCAVVAAEFGQVGCHAACFAATVGQPATCPLSCCSQESPAKPCCLSRQSQPANDCGKNCPQCPICRAPTRAITSSKSIAHFVVAAMPHMPAAILLPFVRIVTQRLELRGFDLIASQHPPLQVLNCVWRK